MARSLGPIRGDIQERMAELDWAVKESARLELALAELDEVRSKRFDRGRTESGSGAFEVERRPDGVPPS